MIAETAYLFRHALLREAAYQLQLPGDRARLHARAFQALESVFGGPPPAPPPLVPDRRAAFEAHPTDAFAAELATHAERAGDAFASEALVYLRRAAAHADRAFRTAEAAALWRRLAELLAGLERGMALYRASAAFRNLSQLGEAERDARAAIGALEVKWARRP